MLLATACSGPCVRPPPTAESVELSPPDIGSDRVVLRWAAVRGATSQRATISATPPGEDGALLHGLTVDELDEDAEELTLEHLPPGVDLTVRIEATTAQGVRADVIRVTTAAAGDGSLRRVAVLSPTVVEVVLRGDDFEDAADGQWETHRDDGEVVPVRAVHRRSAPVSQPEYEEGFRGPHDDSVVVTDHHLYLVLGEALESGRSYRFDGPEDLVVLLPFDDEKLTTPVVQLNQVGYNPAATKRWAYASAWLGDGGPLDLDGFPEEVHVLRFGDDGGAPTRVATLPWSLRSERDEASGSAVLEVDLSTLPADEGAHYRLHVPGVGVSHPTQVSQRASLMSFWVGARGLFHNRWAGDLAARYTDWTRPVDHEHVFTADKVEVFDFFAEDTPQRGRRSLRGGYHDAGDFDQRPTHTVVPQLLLRAYESRADAFVDDQLAIPESGNGIPDLLDEALWGVAAWEQLQEDDGGVRAGVESFRHPWGIYLASDDELPYWTYARDAAVSARAAGLFAQAARLVRPFDEARSDRLRERALSAWRWAEAHDVGDVWRLYPLGELYRLTAETRHRAGFEDAWRRIGPYGAFSNFARNHLYRRDYEGGGRVMPDFILGYLGAEPIDAEIAATARRWLTQEADRAAAAVLESPHAHRNGRGSQSPGWGQGTVMGRYLDAIVARLSLGDVPEDVQRRYFDAMSVAADFVLGANPLGMSFITGLGTVHPREPLHLDSLVFVKRGLGPVPGVPVYGPVDGIPSASYYRHGADALHPTLSDHPPMRRYVDLRTFVTTNECTVWECTAPHAQHFALLAPEAALPPRSWLPGQAGHRSTLPSGAIRPAGR